MNGYLTKRLDDNLINFSTLGVKSLEESAGYI